MDEDDRMIWLIINKLDFKDQTYAQNWVIFDQLALQALEKV